MGIPPPTDCNMGRLSLLLFFAEGGREEFSSGLVGTEALPRGTPCRGVGGGLMSVVAVTASGEYVEWALYEPLIIAWDSVLFRRIGGEDG